MLAGLLTGQHFGSPNAVPENHEPIQIALIMLQKVSHDIARGAREPTAALQRHGLCRNIDLAEASSTSGKLEILDS